MGYDITFEGGSQISPSLTREQREYLRSFTRTRRVRRDPSKAAELPDPQRLKLGLPVGDEGAFFVGSGYDRKEDDPSVIDANSPPAGQPGLWCQWVPNDGGDVLEWDGREKFVAYFDWLRYLIEAFFQPWGCVLDGRVSWKGDNYWDLGELIVERNKIRTINRRPRGPVPLHVVLDRVPRTCPIARGVAAYLVDRDWWCTEPARRRDILKPRLKRLAHTGVSFEEAIDKPSARRNIAQMERLAEWLKNALVPLVLAVESERASKSGRLVRAAAIGKAADGRLERDPCRTSEYRCGGHEFPESNASGWPDGEARPMG
jgi:hypothetical protein